MKDETVPDRGCYAIRRHGAVASMEIVHSGNCSCIHDRLPTMRPVAAQLLSAGDPEVPEEVILSTLKLCPGGGVCQKLRLWHGYRP